MQKSDQLCMLDNMEPELMVKYDGPGFKTKLFLQNINHFILIIKSIGK